MDCIRVLIFYSTPPRLCNTKTPDKTDATVVATCSYTDLYITRCDTVSNDKPGSRGTQQFKNDIFKIAYQCKYNYNNKHLLLFNEYLLYSPQLI